ncbi:MAG: nitroreductase family protein [Bacteroidales bacterium]|nr:nitroreductase family protein [Bacteroidales bacterium]
MEYLELIHHRESVRSYDTEQKISKDILNRIAEAGRLAPSAANRQPWKFLIVSSEEMLKSVRACYTKQWFADAPHILVVVGNKNDAWVRSFDSYNSIETDLTIAMDHMILAATNEGIGTCWIAAFDPEILRNALSLSKNEVIFAITPLGYPGKNYQKKNLKNRKSLDEIVQFM